jgi:hypothetical protein
VTARRISSRKRPVPVRKMAGGSCLCGEVAFELVRSAGRVMDCQCARCRRTHNRAHASNIFVDSAKFRWVRGESQVSNYGPPKDWHFGTAFCRLCGSTLPRVVRSVGLVVVPSATLDNDPAAGAPVRRPMVGVESRAEWLSIRDDTPHLYA